MGEILFFIYLAVLVVATLNGLKNFKFFDVSLVFFFFFLGVSLISEIAGLMLKKLIGTKAPVYHIYSIIELTLLCCYFMCINSNNVKKSTFFLITGFACLLGLGNLTLFQPIMTYNTNVLMVESILIIGMCLYSLYKMLIREDISIIYNYLHFRISISILILWTSTFFFWAFLKYLKQHSASSYSYIENTQAVINILLYLFIGLSFHQSKNVKPIN